MERIEMQSEKFNYSTQLSSEFQPGLGVAPDFPIRASSTPPGPPVRINPGAAHWDERPDLNFFTKTKLFRHIMNIKGCIFWEIFPENQLRHFWASTFYNNGDMSVLKFPLSCPLAPWLVLLCGGHPTPTFAPRRIRGEIIGKWTCHRLGCQLSSVCSSVVAYLQDSRTNPALIYTTVYPQKSLRVALLAGSEPAHFRRRSHVGFIMT